MKKYLLIFSLILSLAFIPTVSFAKKETTDNNVVTETTPKKDKATIKAEKEALKLQKKTEKAELKAKKLAEKVAKDQKIDEIKAQKAGVNLKTNNKADKGEKTVKTEKSEKIENKPVIKVQENVPQKQEIKVQPAVEVKPVGQTVKVNTKTQKDAVKNIDLKNETHKEINAFFTKFAELQNKHSILAIKKLYSDNFINTDGYNKVQLFELMKKTFKSYPDLYTTYQVKQITVNGDFAMVYVSENIKATTKQESQITGDKGEYRAVLDDIFYLKKVSNEWQIYSENVVYENSVLAHGMAKNLKYVLSAPQKVLCGQEYSATVKVEVPEGYSAIASINSTQIVDGYNMKGEKFRQVSADDSSLERVLKANSDRNNEAVVVSVGYTKISQDIFKKPKVDISGLMILMQRVDIIPANSNYKVAKDKKSDNE